MTEQQITRRLAAILAADVVGYSRMMERRRGRHRRGAAARSGARPSTPPSPARHGRIVKMMGDGALVEFGSVVDAVECAVAIQRAMGERNLRRRAARRVPHRHQSRRHRHRGRRHFWRRRQRRGAPRRPGAAGRHPRLRRRPRAGERQGRRQLHDAGEISLKNIERPLRVWRWDGDEAAGRASHVAAAPRRSAAEKPSIAVLPFSVMSNDPEQEFFADGLVEDILTTLSKLSGLSVIARNSSFAYKGRAVDVRQVARELGVRYVLEGSVRKAGNRIRITAQLIDATTGVHIWADRYDRGIDDIFAVQDEITLTLATEMQVRLTEGEQARLRYTTTTNVEAWNLWIEGLNYDRGPDHRREPHPGPPLLGEGAGARSRLGAAQRPARLHAFRRRPPRLVGDDRETRLRKAEAYVERALAIDPENPDAHRSVGGILLIEVAIRRGRRRRAQGGRSSAPTCPTCWSSRASSCTCSGRAAEAIGQIEKAMALSPNYHAVAISACSATPTGSPAAARRRWPPSEPIMRAAPASAWPTS